MTKLWKISLFILLMYALIVWYAVFSLKTKDVKIISCNVGQGDASLIISENIQILIDGGPGNRVLECLSNHVPFWDRKIEAVILTHPEADHFTGLIEVFRRYRVEKIFANSLEPGTQSYELLKKQVAANGSQVINPTAGMSLRSDLIQLDILHPSEEYLQRNSTPIKGSSSESNNKSYPSQGRLGVSSTKTNLNEFSIVTMLRYGSFKFLFPGDISKQILSRLASDPEILEDKPVNYIKVPHHGSKSSLSPDFYGILESRYNPDSYCLKGFDKRMVLFDKLFNWWQKVEKGTCINRQVAIISVGKNFYGHPNDEVIKMLEENKLMVLRTDMAGDIVFQTDGKDLWLKNNSL